MEYTYFFRDEIPVSNYLNDFYEISIPIKELSKKEDIDAYIDSIKEKPEVATQEYTVAINNESSTPVQKSPITSKNFKSKLLSTYEKILKEKGINKDYAKYLVAQDALESNWGKSSLSDVNNFGGIKATGNSPYVEK